MAYPGPSAFEISRFEAHLVSNYLAGPALNSRLILELREKRGIAYHVESAYQSYDEAGMLSIYFGTEKDQIPIALKVIDRELEKLMNTPLGPRQLNLLKRQVKGHIAMADESGASVAISMARNLITYNKLESTQEIHQLIDAISVESLQASARRMFGDGKVLLEFLQK